MYNLNEETKKTIAESIGVPYEKLINMDEEEIAELIQQKGVGQTKFSQHKPVLGSSGDDSVLIDSGRIHTMDRVDKRLNKIAKKGKSKQKQDEDELGK